MPAVRISDCNTSRETAHREVWDTNQMLWMDTPAIPLIETTTIAKNREYRQNCKKTEDIYSKGAESEDR